VEKKCKLLVRASYVQDLADYKSSSFVRRPSVIGCTRKYTKLICNRYFHCY